MSKEISYPKNHDSDNMVATNWFGGAGGTAIHRIVLRRKQNGYVIHNQFPTKYGKSFIYETDDRIDFSYSCGAYADSPFHDHKKCTKLAAKYFAKRVFDHVNAQEFWIDSDHVREIYAIKNNYYRDDNHEEVDKWTQEVVEEVFYAMIEVGFKFPTEAKLGRQSGHLVGDIDKVDIIKNNPNYKEQ
tara:strand:+ start:363 stop:920 length:558 start_codon:yes stop_codon:yes gene_type:complete